MAVADPDDLQEAGGSMIVIINIDLMMIIHCCQDILIDISGSEDAPELMSEYMRAPPPLEYRLL